MTRTPRAVCPFCRLSVAVTTGGRIWTHGPTWARCPGSRRTAQPSSSRPVRKYWPARHRGRRIVTVPGPDTWNPTTLLEGAL